MPKMLLQARLNVAANYRLGRCQANQVYLQLSNIPLWPAAS